MNMNGTTLFLLALGSFFVFRLYARKAVGNSSQSRPIRLVRIRNASLLFRMFIGISLLVGVYWVLGFLFGWPFFSQDKVRIVISHSHIYTSRAEMPPAIFALWLVKTGLGLGSAAVLFALFQLYGQGILFAARNVRYIRFLGYWLIIDWIIDYQMQGTLHDMDLSTTPVFVGLIIIFIAWIMDEGRKIQEEQELTV
jgi:hypothetical protein